VSGLLEHGTEGIIVSKHLIIPFEKVLINEVIIILLGIIFLFWHLYDLFNRLLFCSPGSLGALTHV